MKISDKKISYFTLKKEWFDLILSGEKKFEFRDNTNYWNKRFESSILKKIISKEEDFAIIFTNGYGKNRPFIRIKCKNIFKESYEVILYKKWAKHNELIEIKSNLITNSFYWVIELGDILETGNICKDKQKNHQLSLF